MTQRILDLPTDRSRSAVPSGHGERASAPAAPALQAAAEGRERVLSFGQERMWLFDQLLPKSALHNVPLVGHLQGQVRAEVLEQSLREIVRRHQVLRMSYVAVAGKPVPELADPPPLIVPVIDFRRLPAAVGRRAAEGMAAREARRPFNLRRAPLVRACLARLADREHLLLLTLHQIACDEWSSRLLVGELGRLYQALLQGAPSRLPELALQYADFAAWQRQWLSGEGARFHLEYSRRILGEEPQPAVLPGDRPRPPVRSFRGAWYRFQLPSSLPASVEALARAERVRPFMVTLTAYAALLGRHGGQQQFVVGSAVANRNRPELEELIGPFTNVVPLHPDLRDDPTFTTLLRQVRELALEAADHQDLPFELLLEELHAAPDLSYHSLFQIFFALHHAPPPAGQLAPGLTQQYRELDTGTSRGDLTLFLRPAPGKITGFVEYATELFDRTTVVRLVGHLTTLLAGAVAAPKCRVGALPLLTGPERQQLFTECNDSAGAIPQRHFHQLVAEHARRHPDQLAVVAGDQELTYGELNRRANRLAHFLRRHGVGADTLVALCVERSPAALVAILAILKAGGAFVPLDPGNPAERLAYMLADCAAPILVTHRDLPQRLAGVFSAVPTVICTDREQEAIARQSDADPPDRLGRENLAYAIYTSGSTGRPKGVMLTHGGLANLAKTTAEAYEVAGDERVLQFAPLSFDASVFELTKTFYAGATLVLLPPEELLPGPLLAARIEALGLNRITVTPSALAAMPEVELPTLRTIVAAGEACPAELMERWARGRKFFNGYGPTEVTVWSARARCRPGCGRPPIGATAPNKRNYVLDRKGWRLPLGVAGELYTAGVGLARGYLGRPALTAERFVPEPFSGLPGARMYRTGDRVRWRPDGELEFLGRIDYQVKLRGFRIELGEIEAVLGAHPGVLEAAVVVREDQPGDPRLVAYLVPRTATPAEPGPLRSWLANRLPDYMVPSFFMFLDGLPRTPHDKIDRRALPVPDLSESQLEADYVPPNGPAEELLAAIWSELLGVKRIGVHDDLFALGAHSLLVIRAVSRLYDTLGINLPLRAIFDSPRIAALAEIVEDLLALAIDQLSDEETERLLAGEAG